MDPSQDAGWGPPSYGTNAPRSGAFASYTMELRLSKKRAGGTGRAMLFLSVLAAIVLVLTAVVSQRSAATSIETVETSASGVHSERVSQIAREDLSGHGSWTRRHKRTSLHALGFQPPDWSMSIQPANGPMRGSVTKIADKLDRVDMKTLPSIEQTADIDDAQLDAKSFAKLAPSAPSKVSLAADNPTPDKRCKDAYEKFGKPVDPGQKFPTYKKWKGDMRDAVLSKGDKGDSLRKIFGPVSKSRANLKECYEALLHEQLSGPEADDLDCLKITDQKKCMELECFWKPGYLTGDCLLEDPEPSGPEPDPVVADCSIFLDKDACAKEEQCEWTEAGYMSKGSCDNKNHNQDHVSMKVKESMDLTTCQQILCRQEPSITDNGASYIQWQIENPSPDKETADRIDACLALVIKEAETQQNDAAGEDFGRAIGSTAPYGLGGLGGAIGEVVGPSIAPDEVEADGKADVTYDSETGELGQQRYSWANAQACQYEVQKARMDEETRQGLKDSNAAGQEKRDAYFADKMEATDVKKLEQAADPNAVAFQPADLSYADCSEMDELPGVRLLSSGFDPLAAPKQPCQFDDCRTTQLFQFTYTHGCKRVLTPGGAFKVPDQITVLNKYETAADTHVYKNERDRDEQLEAHAGIKMTASAEFFIGDTESSVSADVKVQENDKSSSEQHMAERKIDVTLYSLFADHFGLKLNHDFLLEATELPLRFATRPTAYLQFLRKWGRYVPKDIGIGGSLVIDMVFTSTSTTHDFSHGVEAAFDMICSGGTADFGVSSSGGYQKNEKSAELMADSKISLLANGGDPQIAAAITDFTPNTHNSATFRGDVQTWLRTIPAFPRLVERVPTLVHVSSILPLVSNGHETMTPEEKEQDRFSWLLRQRAMRQAIQVMETSSDEALHADTQDCKSRFDWQDFNRFSTGECLSFGIRTPADIDIAIAERPGSPSGSVLLHLGTHQSKLQYFDVNQKRWLDKWASDDNLALTTGSLKLMSKFWVCLRREEQATFVNMGVRDIQLFDLRLDDIAQDRPFEPRYFALKCSIPIGTFTSVTVDSWNHFRHFIEAKHNVQTEICKIPNCKTHHAEGLGNSPETCKCTQCKEGFTLLPGPALEYDKCEESSWKVDITSIPKSLTSVADVEKLDWNLAFMSKGCFNPGSDHATDPNLCGMSSPQLWGGDVQWKETPITALGGARLNTLGSHPSSCANNDPLAGFKWTFSVNDCLAEIEGRAWNHCSDYGGECTCNGKVRFGDANTNAWSEPRDQIGTKPCPAPEDGDPKYGSPSKTCQCQPEASSPPSVSRDRAMQAVCYAQRYEEVWRDVGCNLEKLEQHWAQTGSKNGMDYGCDAGDSNGWEFKMGPSTEQTLISPVGISPSGGDMVMLTHFNFDCGPDKAMTKFHILQGSGDFMIAKMWCAKPEGPQGGETQMQCEARDTPNSNRDKSFPGEKQVYKLAEQTVKCNQDEMLQRFWMGVSGTQFDFHFTCCKVLSQVPKKCHMEQCAVKARAESGGGFCLREFGSCWKPKQQGTDAFFMEASSAGQYMGAEKCDSEIDGAGGMMACYQFESKDAWTNSVWTTKTVNFDSYESFRATVPGLTSWNYYAWKISGTVIFAEAKTVIWCVDIDDAGVAAIKGDQTFVRLVVNEPGEKCSDEVAYSKYPAQSSQAFVEIVGFQETGGVQMKFYYKDMSNGGVKVFPTAIQIAKIN